MQKTLILPRSYINFSAISSRPECKIKINNFKRREFVFGGILAFLIIAFYIFQINLMVERNYQIRELESQISRLQQDNQKLTVEALALENSGLLADQASYFGLEANDKIQYVRIFTPTLVRSR